MIDQNGNQYKSGSVTLVFWRNGELNMEYITITSLPVLIKGILEEAFRP